MIANSALSAHVGLAKLGVVNAIKLYPGKYVARMLFTCCHLCCVLHKSTTNDGIRNRTRLK